jgi:phosphoglycolate phosphatase
MLRRHEGAPIPFARLRQSVSDGARGLIETAFGLAPEQPEFEPLRQELLALYSEHLGQHTALFEGMAELLAEIEARRLRWGIVTNKPALYAAPLLQALQLDRRCAVLICPDHVQNRKPHPEPLQLACRRLGCAPEQAVYLGDHRRDIEAGRNAGMAAIACAFGYVHDDDPCSRWGADAIVAHPQEILPLLRGRFAAASSPTVNRQPDRHPDE